MTYQGRLLALVLLLLTAAGALAFVGSDTVLRMLPWHVREAALDAEHPSNPSRDRAVHDGKPAGRQGLANQKTRAPTAIGPGPTIDVARIGSEGVSVIAGKAMPGRRIAVQADGQPVGEAVADDNGEWVIVTEHRFLNKKPDIKVTEALPAANSKLAETGNRTEPARAETDRQLNTFKDLIDVARSQGANSGASSPGPRSGVAPLAAGRLPLPIEFVYRESQLTDKGRMAAGLLLEYLKVKSLDRVTLTGHADEVGSHEYNMALSRERLAVVQEFLRKGGYKGKLKMIPKGETEPYSAVDRSRYSEHALHQLDRRVELRTN